MVCFFATFATKMPKIKVFGAKQLFLVFLQQKCIVSWFFGFHSCTTYYSLAVKTNTNIHQSSILSPQSLKPKKSSNIEEKILIAANQITIACATLVLIYIVFVLINIVFVLKSIVNIVFVLLNIVFVLINIVFIGTSLIFLAPPWEFSSLGFTTLLLSGERPPRTLNFDPNDLHCYKESCTWMKKLIGHNCSLFKSYEGRYDSCRVEKSVE